MLSNEIMLLKLIKVNGSLTPLRKRGLTHAQIAALLQKHLDNGCATITESGVALTRLGEEVLAQRLKALEHRPQYPWILPQEDYYRKPLSKWEIVLPKKI